MLLLLILCTGYSLDPNSCPALNCSTNRIRMDCMELIDSSTMNIYKCTPGYVCPTQALNNTDKVANVSCKPLIRNSTCTGSSDLTSGRACCTNNDCKSEECLHSICTPTTACDADEDCVSNTYCVDANCMPTFKTGSPCSHENQCSIGDGCNNGYCTTLTTLDIGAPAEDSKFCVTGFAYDGLCESIQITVNKTIQKAPYECFLGDLCNYTLTVSKKFFNESACICAGDGSYKGYCSAYIIYDYDLSSNLYNYLGYSSSNCGGNYTKTLDPDILLECGSISKSNYYNFIQGLYRAYYWNLYQSNVLDSCALMLGLYDPNASEGILIMFSLGIIVFT